MTQGASDVDEMGMVLTALERVEGLSNGTAGVKIGVSEPTVRRWRSGDIALPLRSSTREALRLFLGLRTATNGAVHVHERPTTAYGETPRSRRVGELIEMLAQKDALRRMARTISDKDLVTSAYAIAIADGWTEEEMQQLDAWRREILGGETNAG